MNVLEDLNNNVYQRTMVNSNDKLPIEDRFKPNSGRMIYRDNIIK